MTLAGGLLLVVNAGSAQQAGGISQQVLQALGQPGTSGQLDNTGAGAGQAAAPNSVTELPPSPSSQPPLPASRLEQIMSARAGAQLTQFGYDNLGRGRLVNISQAGAVQDNYILGIGDAIVVTLRGQENSEFRATVNNSGQVVLPRLSPISAAGRNFGSLRTDIEAAVRRAYVATNAFVSVGQVRQITVLVSGEVNLPGTRIVPGLSTVVDAILLSGGVKKTGSLRTIRIRRGDRTFTVDLYAVLSSASDAAGQMQLADGDRILVPPLGKMVAVSGLVRQPGIFELPSGQSAIKTPSLLALAGGVEVRGRYRFSVLRVAPDGNTHMVPLEDGAGVIGDSEILFVQLGTDQTANQATLSGGSALAGRYPVVEGTKISEILKAPGALPEAPYTLFGIISRKDPRTLLRTLVAFTPVAVLSGMEDQALRSDDIVRVFSMDEARLLTDTVQLYNQRQDAAQAALRNPLAENGPTRGNPPTQLNIPTQGGTSDQIPQMPQNLTVANSTLSQADIQRRDIAELATQVDPVTRQTISSQAEAEETALAQQQLAYQLANPKTNLDPIGQFQSDKLSSSAPSSNDILSNVVSSSQGNNAQAISQRDGRSLPRLAVTPPAPNYQLVDPNSGHPPANRDVSNFAELARLLGVDQLVLVNFLIDHQATLSGAVGGPGSYFIGPNVPLQDLVKAAGGTANWADQSGVELISTAVDPQTGHSATSRTLLPLHQGTLVDYIVRPRDQLRFNQIFTDAGQGTATVQGELRFPGSYQITRGEHLSDLLARAGGLTNIAYPNGTVFLRKSAASAEREGYHRAASEIEEQLVVAMTRIGNDKIDAGSFAALQSFVTQLRNQEAIGRIAIVADPSVLATRPELDPLLEPGDVVYIPQRPSTISVLGQVMQAGTVPYRANNTLEDYIETAGGYSTTSDESDTFIVLPDGSARRVERSLFSFSSVNLPPGSSIVVPRDITPLNTRQLILDMTGIFSSLAVTAASLAVLSHQ